MVEGMKAPGRRKNAWLAVVPLLDWLGGSTDTHRIACGADRDVVHDRGRLVE
jgi:hypothetical protein